MIKKIRGVALIAVFAIVACTNEDTSEPEKKDAAADAATADPALVYCQDNGGTLEIRKDGEGNAYGLCVFANGSECKLWEYYRGECKPDNQTDADTIGGQQDAG
jgi:putative hemolysin